MLSEEVRNTLFLKTRSPLKLNIVLWNIRQTKMSSDPPIILYPPSRASSKVITRSGAANSQYPRHPSSGHMVLQRRWYEIVHVNGTPPSRHPIPVSSQSWSALFKLQKANFSPWGQHITRTSWYAYCGLRFAPLHAPRLQQLSRQLHWQPACSTDTYWITRRRMSESTARVDGLHCRDVHLPTGHGADQWHRLHL